MANLWNGGPLFGLLSLTILLLLSPTRVSGTEKCIHKLDIVIAIDTTSSTSVEEFSKLTAQVKGIASQFTIGQVQTRLALISMSQSAQVVANFNNINTLSDFNAAVDSLTLTAGQPVVISEGMKLARGSVLSSARRGIPASLILVKNRRSDEASAEAGAAELKRMTAEAEAVRSMGAAVHAVAIGGVWNSDELKALFGSDYLLFKSRSKATESSKSLNNLVCGPVCKDSGVTENKDPCLMGFRRVRRTTVSEVLNKDVETVCRTELEQRFEECKYPDTCCRSHRTISYCEQDGNLTIEDSWQYFDKKRLELTVHKESHRVLCGEARMSCPSQKGDLIIAIEEDSGKDIKKVSRIILKWLNVGPDKLRVGIFSFLDKIRAVVPLSNSLDNQELLDRVNSIRSDNINTFPNTHLMLDKALEVFRRDARPGADKFLLIITVLKSMEERKTAESIVAIKEAGVTIFVMAAGSRQVLNEHVTMTAPLTDSNFMQPYDYHGNWGDVFGARLCILMSNPKRKLCDEKFSQQSVSNCMGSPSVQVKSFVEFKYDSSNNCVKHTKTTLLEGCKTVCSDPMTGSQYIDGEQWTTACHRFTCDQTWNLKNERPPNAGCPDSDANCRAIDSAPFRCSNSTGTVVDNCRCIKKHSRAVVVIDRSP